MLSIILAIILGIGFTIIGIQNSTFINFKLFDTVLYLPIYAFLAVSFLSGIFVTLIFNLFDKFSNLADIQNKDTKINQFERLNKDLQNEVNKLKQQNMVLEKDLQKANASLRNEKVQNIKDSVKNFTLKLKHGVT